MATPRRLLVDPVNACDYHLVSRCVQGALLCGRDRRTGRDYSHRRQWLVDRLELLARCFAVEVYAYSIMSNHLVARYDPLACWRWSDEEVARRWVDAFPADGEGSADAGTRCRDADGRASRRRTDWANVLAFALPRRL